MPEVLLVEDDPNLGMLLKEYLNAKGYHTDLAVDGQQGWEEFVRKDYDLCIFDVMMPKMDGFSLVKEVRMSGKDVPVIFLTARSLKEDTLQGFRMGADDYITKPFEREELLLRIEAILRRYQKKPHAAGSEPSVYNFGIYTYDADHHLLKYRNESIKLTSKEAGLLKLFCQNFNQPISRSYALKMIWGDDSYFNARSMDVYLSKLRKYLREDPSVQIINLHGEGFKMMI